MGLCLDTWVDVLHGVLLSEYVPGHVVCSYVRVDRVRACDERVSVVRLRGWCVVRRELAKARVRPSILNLFSSCASSRL